MMRGRYTALVVLAIGAGFAGGYALDEMRTAQTADAGGGPDILYWVAPMDPNFRKDGPGKSPMGMDLVPVYAGQEPSGAPDVVSLSAAEINTIGVRSAVAQVENIAEKIETVGFVGYDEHLTSHIHMRVEGWIEHLQVRALGDVVRKGDLLFELYAPEITIASSELLRAARSKRASEINGARQKLRNFGVTDQQIDEMAKEGSPSQIVRVYAPQDGVVTQLTAADGMYLKPDVRALSLSNLASVWLLVDVFERDIGRLSPRMRAEAQFDHLPGQMFSGEIDYIFPELDPKTRTVKVRLRFDNPDDVLRPNMFAKVALIPETTHEALTVPSEAVIRTGRAERVILRQPDGSFRPRLVTTGLRGGFGDGRRTQILQGLEPGDEVVASAQFLIDSESALNAGLQRFAPTTADPAEGKAELVALDPTKRQAVLRHEAIEAMGWPAMETSFTYAANVSADRLAPGAAVRFSVVRGSDGMLTLMDLRPDDGIEATGTGMVHAVTDDGKLSVSHDPIPALSWPAMTMDLPFQGVDPASVPLDQPVVFDLAKGADGMFVIVGLRGAETGQAPKDDDPAMSDAMSGGMSEGMSDASSGGMDATPITVTGMINSVDADAGSANITHGPIEAIGMMGMTMDFPLADGVDPATLPLGKEVEIRMSQGDGMMLRVAGVAEVAQ